MRTRNLLLASLLVALYGCQPETPTQPPAGSAMEPPVAPTSVPVAMTPAPSPEQTAVPVPVEKAAPVVQEKPVAMTESAAKPAVAAPTVKVEPAAVAAKPEVKAGMSEADALGLAKKSGCLVCHTIDKKVVGPAWKDVAAKYRGDAGAEARIMDKIAKGGSGVWGSIAMPPNSRLSEADRQALARFVLSLK
ncbi:MAG: c-type cytochrome [Gallionella sp.]|nr:c-type cytochrome [Gallionella sp.]MCK9354837.1 c-type cytochrome [Gallionella sp.]